MDRLRFRETLHCSLGLTDDLMLDRIFSSFDGDNEGNVSESEWVLGLSVMLKGTLDEQINYCYEVFDINLDHGIGREELHSCLRGCLHPVRGTGMDELDLEEGSREIVELVMRKMDLDRDGQIKFSDFRDAVNFDPLLLQVIGLI
jgi:Ca2+-binding EF-hand superfamily protein